MAEPEVRIETTRPGDVEMGDDDNEGVTEAIEAPEGAGDEAADGDADATAVEDVKPMPTFVDYLRSPIVEIAVGDPNPVVLTAHQLLLEPSPFFRAALEAFSADVTVRRIALPGEDLSAVGAFLQYLYTGEYFPRRVAEGLEPEPLGARTGESAEADAADLALAGGDPAGAQQLRHARVYTLAEKLGLAELQALALSKVHRVTSTARGELAYARYVYGHSRRDDGTVRRPIAAFWGQRSHVLRHEAESEFRALCLDFPDFAFDVLSHVLDSREKKHERRDTTEDTPGRPGRKRMRQI